MANMDFLRFLAIFFFFFVHSHCNGQNHHFLVWNLNLWKSFLSLQKMYNIIQLQNMVSLYLKGHDTCYEYEGFMHVYDTGHSLNYDIFLYIYTFIYQLFQSINRKQIQSKLKFFPHNNPFCQNKKKQYITYKSNNYDIFNTNMTLFEMSLL